MDRELSVGIASEAHQAANLAKGHSIRLCITCGKHTFQILSPAGQFKHGLATVRSWHDQGLIDLSGLMALSVHACLLDMAVDLWPDKAPQPTGEEVEVEFWPEVSAKEGL